MRLTKEQLDQAINQNLIAYDQDAEVGLLSFRLILILNSVLVETFHDELIEIITNRYPNYDNKFEQGTEFDLKEYYLETGCLLPQNKLNIIVARGANGTHILGAY